MKTYLFILFVISFFINSYANSPADSLNNYSTEAHQFDFWIGDWNIQQKILAEDGTYIKLNATTSVRPLLNGSALEEHWSGDVQYFWQGMKKPEPLKGFSLRYFDTSSGKWNIYWMDTRNRELGEPYTGNFYKGKGEFFAEMQSSKRKQISRITFSDINKDSVHWDLAISNDDGKTWKIIWIMEMTRKEI
jgi:hypothetical protein